MLDLGLMKRAMTAPPAAPAPAASKAAAAPAAAPAASASDGAVQMLALLQGEARLVDFLLEDVGPYTDEQIGSAVRGIHDSCKVVLERHVKLTPVIDGIEGAIAKVAGMDNASVKLLGNVPADGKAESGILRHRGWKVDKINLPTLKAGKSATIVAPAEIEIE